MKNNRYTNWFFAAAVVVAGFSMAACEDEPDKYEVAGGKPTLKYVRVPDPAAADSLLTGAYMANTICLVGENLRSVYELYFNDQKAILNTSYITDHTLMVDVPKEIPSVVTDKIYMVTKAKDTIDYDFKVLVPAPTVNSISCEFAKPGSEVTLIGDYFIDDPNVPLTITMAGNVEVTNITNITKTAVSFILPDNAPAGYINVKSIYGTGRSKFRYYDTRNILFDWDGSHGGMAIAHGWRDGSKVLREADENSIDGAYICLTGALDGAIGATWAEDEFSFNYWPEPSAGYPELSARPEFAELLEEYGVNGLQLKFEVNIPSSNPWQSCALQVMFTGNDVVTYATGTNAYFSDTNVPLTITMAGNVEVTNITNITKTAVSFILPDNAPAGYINVKSIYGTGRSKFRYYDTRNILFDWDGSHGGMAIAHGWRDGSKVLREADENSIDGAYICLTGALDGAIGATWAEDEFSFNYWPEPSAGYPELSARPEFAELLEEYGVNGLQLKFEVNIPSSNPWQSCALQVMFTGNDVVTYATGTNAYFSDTNVPRGLWLPWKNTGSYDTGGKWTTVSMNLSEFNKTHEGNKCDRTFDKTMLTGLTFFVWAGGVEGKDCNPVIMIDNIRVVPIE